MDRRYGLDTAGQVDHHELGYDPGERGDYDPSRWLALRIALPRRRVTDDDVFADLGSGKGRVLLQAARRFPFKRVIGVELSAELNEIAEANLAVGRHRLRCPQVELVTTDASEWLVPNDLTIVYLYNPFRGRVFSRAVHCLAEAVDRRNTPLRIIYVNPVEHERLMQTGRVVELTPPAALPLRLAGLPRGAVRRYELRPQPSGG